MTGTTGLQNSRGEWEFEEMIQFSLWVQASEAAPLCVFWGKVHSCYQFLKKLRTSKPLILQMKTETQEDVTFLGLRVSWGKAGPAQGFQSPSMPLPLYHSTGLGRKTVT